MNIAVMTERVAAASPRFKARIAGVLSLLSLLAGLSSGLGFQAIRTYIQSGNVIFESRLSEEAGRASMVKALAARMEKKIDVLVRTPAEMPTICPESCGAE
jgi:uncharacterized protein (DUF1697 family)